jgi:hypothetical protein
MIAELFILTKSKPIQMVFGIHFNLVEEEKFQAIVLINGIEFALTLTAEHTIHTNDKSYSVRLGNVFTEHSYEKNRAFVIALKEIERFG